ncbi:MAG: sodium/proton-translocating pyrophosphatase, partial [Alphaproteobacteria bacterium]|nr:sodium/proton-translocating pyrophosphatase [Alphaproteobacteria bacterium]
MEYIIIGCGILAVLYGAITSKSILSLSAGNARMQEIAAAIQEGATAYLNRQYMTISLVGVVVTLILGFALSWTSAIGFIIGAVLSGAAGYIGMIISVRANVRTTEASRESLAAGLSVSFKSGAVTGMLVAGLALLAIAGYYFVLVDQYDVNDANQAKNIIAGLVGLAFGASLISIFARLGGGIFTKGADVGADLVGKVEAGIPEDDPRNPAVIADNVGDNVGDCAGMAADLFETYVVTVGATMVLALIYGITGLEMSQFLMYPMMICAVCLVASIIGTYFVRLGGGTNIMGALYKGLVASAVLSAVALYFVTDYVIGMDLQMTVNGVTFTGMDLFMCGIVGLVLTGLIVWVTEYYTST